MRLYVANLTRQIQDFTYRLPNLPGLKRQTIPIGQQVVVGGDLASSDIDAIIDQHKIYGMVAAEELDRANKRLGYVGLAFSVDKPVRDVKILAGLEHNMDVLEDRGKTMRQQSAVAANSMIEQHLKEQQIAELQTLEMTVEQEERKGESVGTDGKELVAEAIRVTRNAPPDPTAQKGARRARA